MKQLTETKHTYAVVELCLHADVCFLCKFVLVPNLLKRIKNNKTSLSELETKCVHGGAGSLLVFLNRTTFFFPIRCKSPLWAVLINKIAFSLAADDFMSEEKGEAVSNLGRNCHHQFQLGEKKTKQILINTKWVIDEQCGRMCWGELWSCRLGMVGCLTRTQRTCKTIL